MITFKEFSPSCPDKWTIPVVTTNPTQEHVPMCSLVVIPGKSQEFYGYLRHVPQNCADILREMGTDSLGFQLEYPIWLVTISPFKDYYSLVTMTASNPLRITIHCNHYPTTNLISANWCSNPQGFPSIFIRSCWMNWTRWGRRWCRKSPWAWNAQTDPTSHKTSLQRSGEHREIQSVNRLLKLMCVQRDEF